MKKTNKKGISLVVLVITIIVMIIIAATIILSINSSGIVERARTAKSSSDDSSIKEAAALYYSEWIMEKNSGESNLASATEYVQTKLKQNGFSQEDAIKVSITNGKVMISNGAQTTNIITFAILGTPFQAEEGMTWAEWEESEYNPTIDSQYIGLVLSDEYTITGNEKTVKDLGYLVEGGEGEWFMSNIAITTCNIDDNECLEQTSTGDLEREEVDADDEIVDGRAYTTMD